MCKDWQQVETATLVKIKRIFLKILNQSFNLFSHLESQHVIRRLFDVAWMKDFYQYSHK